MKSALLLSLLALSGCFSKSEDKPAAPVAEKAPEPVSMAKVGPTVDENYAWSIILAYEKFGPKVPGTDAHKKAHDWLVKELKDIGIPVTEQNGTAKTWDGKTIPVYNVIAQVNPEAKTRYLLSAHWDNRPWADEDPVAANRKKPVPGVNDGGSGVAVLLMIAKAAKLAPPEFGIDFAFFDAEDWGNPRGPEDTYCLGTQMWAKDRVPKTELPKFGINYDMVGRIGSMFPIESFSKKNAPQVINGILAAAKTLGYGDTFPDFEIGSIIDDHVFVAKGTGIPMVDLIFVDPNGRFPPEWHTVDDTSKYISRDVLKIVAQTTVQLLWSQK
ncbi:MAG: M28 family peptidase [Bdellovibrionales bacterium]|nr:M28 family peptidase [Bdellovibrionales bacterium]